MIEIEITDALIETVAKNVIKLRNEAGLSQTQLGNIISFDQSTISAIENKRSGKFSIEAVKRISNYFGHDLGVKWLESKPEVYLPSFDNLLEIKIRKIVREELEQLDNGTKKYPPKPSSEIIEQSGTLHYGNKGRGKSKVKRENLDREIEKMKTDPKDE